MNGPYRQNVADWITVRIEDAAGDGVTGIAYDDASLAVKVAKAGAASVTKTLTAVDWVAQSDGYYWVKLLAADLDTVGAADLIVIYDGIAFAFPFRVFAANVDTIKADTANLDVAVSTRASQTAAPGWWIQPSNAAIASIMAKTDLLPANPASQTNLDVAISTRLAAASYTAPDNATIAAAKADTAAIKLKTDALPANPAAQTNLDVAISSRLAAAAYVAPDNAGIAAVQAATGNLDVAVSTRMAAASYDAPDNAGIAAILARTDVATSTRLASADYDAPPDLAGVLADTAAIKAKTDALPADPAAASAVAAVATAVAVVDDAVSALEISMSATAASVSAVSTAVDDVAEQMGRALGLLDENTVRDQVVFTGDDVTAARIRIYDSAVNAAAAGATGLIATYAAAYTYASPGRLSSATVTLVTP
jgi:hypothetical protein